MMKPASIVAFVCYALAAIVSMAFGIMYLVRSQFMPYHQEAIGKDWQDLGKHLQALLLGLMRMVGGGMFSAGLSVAILLMIPYRAGEVWSLYAIPAIGIVTAIAALIATISIKVRTGAHTPVGAGVISAGLILLGFILSLSRHPPPPIYP
jgi:hypothetical protein